MDGTCFTTRVLHFLIASLKKISRVSHFAGLGSLRQAQHFRRLTGAVHLLDILFVPHKISQKVLRNGSLPISHLPESEAVHFLGRTIKNAIRRGIFCCPPSRDRTYDPLLKRQVLYRLSYRRMYITYTIFITDNQYRTRRGRKKGRRAQQQKGG